MRFLDEKKGLSRRTFLKAVGMGAAGAAGIGSAGLLAACSKPVVSEEDPAPTQGVTDTPTGTAPAEASDWLGSAPAIAEADIAHIEDTDIVVIGSGAAGSFAAVGALEKGAKVVVLEKHSTFHNGGSSVSFLNSNYQLSHGAPKLDPTQLLYAYIRGVQHGCDFSLIAKWAYQSGAIFDYIVEHIIEPAGDRLEIKLVDQTTGDPELDDFYNTYLEIGTPGGNSMAEGLGPFLGVVHEFIAGKGGDIRYNTRAHKLLQDATGRVSGVIAQDESGAYYQLNALKAVVVCTGSYGSNEAMTTEFQSPRIASLFKDMNVYPMMMQQPPAEPLDTGDGHLMLCWAGAEMEERTHGYNGWVVGSAPGFPFLMVNQAARRFTNEAQSILMLPPTVVEQPGTPISSWKILDADYATVGMGNCMDPNETIKEDQLASGIQADHIEDLAEMMGVNPETLKATVDRYNELCEKGFDEDFGKLPKYLKPVKTPPFYADVEMAMMAVTLGGVKVGHDLQVLNAAGEAIGGVYAAGNTVGRRFGWNYEAECYGMTNALGITHGFIAGQNAAGA
ncbi:MAG: FAD-binding protein [Coriobacteriales bacterium]|nr:FAD-binding protein [Coriobacteriales bacterium]